MLDFWERGWYYWKQIRLKWQQYEVNADSFEPRLIMTVPDFLTATGSRVSEAARIRALSKSILASGRLLNMYLASRARFYSLG